MQLVPPLKCKGRFVLKAPFVADPSKVWTVISLRTFVELVNASVNIFKEYYEPMKLTQADYERDWREQATLVILYNELGGTISVPSSYIQSFPSTSSPNYANYVLSALLGPFREDYDFDFTTQKVKETLSDTLGYEPEVFIDAIGESSPMSVEDSEVLEANRQASINDRKTSYAENLELKEQVAELQEQIRSLQSVLP